MEALYISYFGLREPLVQTQVLPYLRQLGRSGIRVFLLTFESRPPWLPEDRSTWTRSLEAEGICWESLKYHKRPSVPATAWDILAGAVRTAWLVRRHGITAVHARSHVPLAMALLARKLVSFRLIFDIRGLMAEEYVDNGIWTQRSLPFRLVKRVEKIGCKQADYLVVLTDVMKQWLVNQGLATPDKIQVIPCCVDMERFSGQSSEEERNGNRRFEIVYAGSTTGLYLVDEMVRFFGMLRERVPDAFFRILTSSTAEPVCAAFQRLAISPDAFSVQKAEPSEVPRRLREARFGISFRRPTFAQIAASPTKIPEYLALGVPAVSNAGIGDIDCLLEDNDVGVVIREFTPQEYGRALEKILALCEDRSIAERCRQTAVRYFDLVEVGGKRYVEVYRKLALQNGGRDSALGTGRAR